MDGFYNSYSALDSRMRMIDIAANNLANAQTTGFKRDFARVLESEGNFSVATHVDLSTGQFLKTGNDLDAAIDGDGLFAIQTPAGIRYTRAGSFLLNSDGELVTKDGAKVLSSSGSPIVAPEGLAAIQDGGVVTVDGKEIATLKIVTMVEKQKLMKEGLDRFQWTGTEQEIQAVPEPRVKGGFLERSNVNPISEMVDLMTAYREFETAQRVVKTLVNDMNGRLIQELGRLT